MASRSPTPNTSHEVEVVQVILSLRVQPATGKKDASKGKKASVPKGKLETKTKELAFTFKSLEENYHSFLSALLKLYDYDKYTPVKKQSRFGIKVAMAKKPKKDAVDIDKFVEYEKFTKKILEEGPSRLMVYLNLDDVKAGWKRRDEGESSADNDGSDEEDSDNGKSGIERELGRIRGRLEMKYANPADSGYTYITNDGERVPLTPVMILEWSRAIYDMTATLNHPPNTLAFDPKKRSRSLFETPKAMASSDGRGSGEGFLQTLSSLFSDARVVLGQTLNVPTTPSNTSTLMANPPSSLATAVSSSPAPKNTPSKLPRFLQYAQEHEGVQNALMFEFALEEKGFGPDVIMMDDFDKSDLVSCGLSIGDALRLKRAARVWWTSPDAKRPRQRSPTPEPPVRIDERLRIRFEKRYVNEDGSESVFGPGIVPGKNFREKEFTWWFHNTGTKTLEKVPDGFIPDIDAEYLNPNAPPYEKSPSPEPAPLTD